jgi:glycolate oxidase FAD binding subunit
LSYSFFEVWMKNEFLDQFKENLRSGTKLIARGAKTKSGINYADEVGIIDLSSISGIKEYNPSEYTFTAFAGTSLNEINSMLSENGQFLPFDPLLSVRGATLGGTVASNLNGPMRYYYGGVRDFILGVQFLDHRARAIRSGGKVVKNAAGFDIPKLMVGSLGSLGPMVELSFKVFPRPKDYITLRAQYENRSDALCELIRLTSISSEILCLELIPVGDHFELLVRLGGDFNLFEKRISTLKELLPVSAIIRGEEESILWEDMNDFRWMPDDSTLVKVPIIPSRVAEIDTYFEQTGTMRRYSAGANVAWIAWQPPIIELDQQLKVWGLTGLVVLGDSALVRLGSIEPNIFYRKIKTALDPSGLWAEV